MPFFASGNPLVGSPLRDFIFAIASDDIRGRAGHDLILGDAGPVITNFGAAGPFVDGRPYSIDDAVMWSTLDNPLYSGPDDPYVTLFAAPLKKNAHLLYSVSIGAGETITVRSPDYPDAIFRLTDGNGKVLVDADLTNDYNRPISYTVATAGTYVLEVLEWTPDWPPRDYDGGIFEGDEQFLVFVSVSGHAASASPPTLLNDTISGNTGNDEIYGQDGSDSLQGNSGDDLLFGGAGDDYLHGGFGNDTLRGGGGADVIYGGPDNDNLFGEEGADMLYGCLGDDRLVGGGSSDLLHGASGNDMLFGGDGFDTLFGGPGEDQLDGGVGEDLLSGGLGNDVLMGGTQADTLRGDAGDDLLIGGEGGDFMVGGLGADTFKWSVRDFGGGGANIDRIGDFNSAQGDLLDLSAIDANPGEPGNNAFTFIGTDAFSGTGGELRYNHFGGNTYVEGDRNGNGIADWRFELDGSIDLQASDFLL